MKDETHVWFGAHDYAVDASVITQLMKLEPDEVLVKGRPKPTSRKEILAVSNSWVLNSKLPKEAHVEEHFQTLLALLQSRANEIKCLADIYLAHLEIGCAIYYRVDFTPGIHLSRDITRSLADLGLEIDFDLYFLKPDKA